MKANIVESLRIHFFLMRKKNNQRHFQMDFDINLSIFTISSAKMKMILGRLTVSSPLELAPIINIINHFIAKLQLHFIPNYRLFK